MVLDVVTPQRPLTVVGSVGLYDVTKVAVILVVVALRRLVSHARDTVEVAPGLSTNTLERSLRPPFVAPRPGLDLLVTVRLLHSHILKFGDLNHRVQESAGTHHTYSLRKRNRDGDERMSLLGFEKPQNYDFYPCSLWGH